MKFTIERQNKSFLIRDLEQEGNDWPLQPEPGNIIDYGIAGPHSI